MNEKQKFDTWNELKKEIEILVSTPTYFPQEGEVWIAFVGKNIGYEQNGAGKQFSRPVVIIKRFNTRMFWCVPLSSKQKQFDFYFNFTDPDNQRVAAILAQLKLMSLERLIRSMYKLDRTTFAHMKDKVRAFII